MDEYLIERYKKVFSKHKYVIMNFYDKRYELLYTKSIVKGAAYVLRSNIRQETIDIGR